MNDIGTLLINSIESRDANLSIMQIREFREKMRDITLGADYVMWITEPTNLTRVHKALVECLDIPPRLLAIRRMALNRTQRAILLVQAIELAIRRVHQL